MKNYFAKKDPIWVDGHYVEDWEVRHIENLPAELHAILIAETEAGNKVNSASNGYPFEVSNIWFSKSIQATNRENIGKLKFSRSETPHDRYECIEHANSKTALIFPLP